MKRSDAAFRRAAYFQIPVAIGEEIFPLKFPTQVCGIFLSMTGTDSLRRDNTLILIHSYRLVSNYHEYLDVRVAYTRFNITSRNNDVTNI